MEAKPETGGWPLVFLCKIQIEKKNAAQHKT